MDKVKGYIIIQNQVEQRFNLVPSGLYTRLEMSHSPQSAIATRNTSKALRNFFLWQIFFLGKDAKGHMTPSEKCRPVRYEKDAQVEVVFNVGLDVTVNIPVDIRSLKKERSKTNRSRLVVINGRGTRSPRSVST